MPIGWIGQLLDWGQFERKFKQAAQSRNSKSTEHGQQRLPENSLVTTLAPLDVSENTRKTINCDYSIGSSEDKRSCSCSATFSASSAEFSSQKRSTSIQFVSSYIHGILTTLAQLVLYNLVRVGIREVEVPAETYV